MIYKVFVDAAGEQIEVLGEGQGIGQWGMNPYILCIKNFSKIVRIEKVDAFI